MRDWGRLRMALTEKLTNIANAIRTKSGVTEAMTLDDMVLAINNISTSNHTITEKAFTITEPTQELDLGIDYTPKHIILNTIGTANYSEYQAFYSGYIDIENGKSQIVSKQKQFGTLQITGAITHADGVIKLSKAWFTNNNLIVVICR